MTALAVMKACFDRYVGRLCVLPFLLFPAFAKAQELDALILTGLDVSSSMNDSAVQIEVEGISAAIQSPEVLSAIQSGPHGAIGFAVFLWANGPMPLVAEWRVIRTAEDAALVAAELAENTEELLAVQSDYGHLTNLTGALGRARELLETAPFPAPRFVVNIVTDGHPTHREADVPIARASLLAMGVTLNGMIVGGKPETASYFRSSVMGGRGCFVMTATKPETLISAMKRKFVADMVSLQQQMGG